MLWFKATRLKNELNRHISRGHIKVVSKQLKRHSTSLIVRETQIKNRDTTSYPLEWRLSAKEKISIGEEADVSGMCEVYMSMVVCEGVYGVWCM